MKYIFIYQFFNAALRPFDIGSSAGLQINGPFKNHILTSVISLSIQKEPGDTCKAL